MNMLDIIFGLQISLLEIVIFQIGAIVLGFSIHFFWSSKKNIRIETVIDPTGINEADEWRLKYYEQLDIQQKLEEDLNRELEESREQEDVLREEIRHVSAEKLELLKKQEAYPHEPAGEYLHQLKVAQENLLQHNHHITRLLEQIDMLKESEKKYSEALTQNEELSDKMRDLRKILAEKENEIKQIKQQQMLAREVKDRLDKAYGEFNLVQEKIQKVENYLVQPHSRSYEFEELQQSYFKLTKDFDEIKLKYISLMEENQRVTRLLSDTEDKLREANFQRQQLLKKVTFLEELNDDLQKVSEHNKKLEGQLKRIGEIEAMLTRLSSKEEDRRDESSML